MIKDIPKLIEKVRKEIKASMSSAVVGLSGGADSTLCAILCREALGAENVFSFHMPYNSQHHLVES